MPTTPRWGIRYPAGTDAPDVPLWMQRMATDLDDVAKDDQGLLANRPVSTVQNPGKRGRYYFATDTKQLFRDNGTGWDEIPIGSNYPTDDQGPLASRPSPGKRGRYYFATDTWQLFRDNGTGWDEIPIGAGQRAEVGDLKYSVHTASHGAYGDNMYAWLLCDGSEVPEGYTALISLLEDAGRPFGIGPNNRPLLPDFRGRVPVAQGIHQDVNNLGDSDNSYLQYRTVRHQHSLGTLAVSAGGLHRHKLEGAGNVVRDETGSGVTWGYVSWNPAAPQYRTAPYTEYDGEHTHNLTGRVGVTNSPLDSPAYLVGGNWFIKT